MSGALKQLEAGPRERATLDALPVMIWTADHTGARRFFGRRWVEFTGREPDQEEGRGWLSGVHPEDADAVTLWWDHARERGRGISLEYRLRRGDGEYRLVLDRAEPGPDGLVGACVDITDIRGGREGDLLREVAAAVPGVLYRY